MKPTIYDIAKVAGVSTATVSKVINQTGRISDKTRKKVLRIIEELQYQPNVLASAMKGKGTHQIAFLIPDIDNPIYAEYLKHIEEHGRAYGYSIVMCSTDNDPEIEARHISLMRQKRTDGFIIASKFSNERLLEELLNDRVPVVLFAHERKDICIDCVTVDDYAGGVVATDHLLSLGHTRIGIIAQDSISCRERIRGYRTALQSAGIAIDDSLIVVGEKGLEEAERSAEKLLQRKDRPSAIFGCNDVVAVGTIKAARKMGIAVPEELSIIGFDDTVWCTIVHPQLSSIVMPVNELGRKVMDVIVGKIERQDDLKQKISMLPQLVARASTQASSNSKSREAT